MTPRGVGGGAVDIGSTRLALDSTAGGAGRVAATVFAEAIGGRTQGGYAVPNEVVSRVLAGANGPVDTGPCVR